MKDNRFDGILGIAFSLGCIFFSEQASAMAVRWYKTIKIGDGSNETSLKWFVRIFGILLFFFSSYLLIWGAD